VSTPAPGTETPSAETPKAATLGPESDEAQAPTLLAVLRALVEDAQTLAEAEVGYVKAAIAFVLGRIKSIAIALVLALFFLFFTLMAIVVGLLLALAPAIGVWAAAGAVTGVLALLTVLCVWLAMRGARQMIALLTGKSDVGGVS